ncbi:hypothetical protein [Saccharolobus islandicus]|nr:hypothetical protein [Sulfolobus islandicus]
MQIACKEDPDRLYFSDNIDDIIKFYYCFNDTSDLIKWSIVFFIIAATDFYFLSIQNIEKH